MVIFGARGDLTKRLLMPALYNLASDTLLSEQFRIVGVDHGDITVETWVSLLTEMMQQYVDNLPTEDGKKKTIDAVRWAWITDRCRYLRGGFGEASTYADLSAKVTAISEEIASKNVLFYVATAPRFFAQVVEGLGQAGLLRESEDAFRRVVIEKPFGHDEPSARELNAQVLKQGEEQQFYRIDHFLGKEPVRGIFGWRFANRMFERIWNSHHIDNIQISAAETVGVETRGPFYEATGALRDMIPSHLFSVLSMVAMEQPASLNAEDVRDAHVNVLKSIKPIKPEDAVRGQYVAGEVRGKPVVAYRESPRVDPSSRIETYAALKLELDMPRWQGVPFYLRTGKALTNRYTSVVVTFKAQEGLTFPGSAVQPNVMEFNLSGRTGISTQLLAKKPGPAEILVPVTSTFEYDEAFAQRPAVGYETLIYDCLRGQQTLFLRNDVIDVAWHVVQPVLDAWGSGGEPEMYPAGTAGPPGADALLAQSGRTWMSLS
jgi:glucose-6-phosphate 1-dehydrogenase